MKYLLSIFLILFFVEGISQDYPLTGTVYNTKQINSVTFDCMKAPNQNKINCRFIQNSIVMNSKNLDEIKEEVIKEWKNNKPSFSKSDCEMINNVKKIITGEIVAPKQEAFDLMSTIQKEDMLKSSEAMLNYCDESSMENMIKIKEIEYDKKKRTCTTYSNYYEMSFNRIDNNTWTAVPASSGTCGVVSLNRFEKVEESGFTFWNYVERKAVTNPSATQGLFPCSQLDESEYKYFWFKDEIVRKCDYIDLGPSFIRP